jgi:glycine cleavage system H protein
MLNSKESQAMPEFLELTYEKFILRIALDRFYSQQGLWFKSEGNQVRMGLSDFVQQRNGDVAFVEIHPEGELLKAGGELVVLETIKVSLSFETPLGGRIMQVNPILEASPEVINQDPYETGWLALIEPENWELAKSQLLGPQAYFTRMQAQIAEEM